MTSLSGALGGKAESSMAPAAAAPHPALPWYERSAAAGWPHGIFRVAEFYAGFIDNASLPVNASYAWELLYRVADADYLGDWPVLAARTRLVGKWLYAHAARLFAGDSAASTTASAADGEAVSDWPGSLRITLSDVWACIVAWPEYDPRDIPGDFAYLMDYVDDDDREMKTLLAAKP